MSKGTDKAGLGMSDVFKAMHEMENDYPVRVRIALDVDRAVLSGRFGQAKAMAQLIEEDKVGRVIASVRVPLPNASTSTTEGMLLRAVLALDAQLTDFFTRDEELA